MPEFFRRPDRALSLAAAAGCALLASSPIAAAQSLLAPLAPPADELLGYYGNSVSGVPDVNGDGVPDFAVGAPGEGDGGDLSFGPGSVYIYSGATRQLLRQFSSPLPITPNQGGFGIMLTGMNDVDGDGFGDVLVGAPYEFPSPPIQGVFQTGHAYLYSGATGNLIRRLESPNPTDGGVFGWSVGSVPDFTGDGRPEVIVGATGEGPNGQGAQYEGAAYVFNGATGSLVRSISSPNAEFFGRFGTQVTGVRDTNGDGLGDYLVAGEDETVGNLPNAGRVYLYSGSTGALLNTFVDPAGTRAYFGYSLAAFDDLDGDGRGDFAIGAVTGDDDDNIPNAGRVIVYSGATGTVLYDLVSPHPQANRGFGWDMSAVGDLNGDGVQDLLIGSAESGDGDPDFAGYAYVYDGATGELIYELPPITPSLYGSFSQAVAGLPDIDGDGLGDLLIGAPGEPDPFATDAAAGRAYLLSGASIVPEPSSLAMLSLTSLVALRRRRA